MDDLLEQVELAAASGAYFLALFCALTLPDICAALDSEDGETSSAKYKAWFDRWMAPDVPPRKLNRAEVEE